MDSTLTLYEEEREVIASLVRDLPAEQAEKRVPACPRWTVRDLISHLAGVAADLAAGNSEGVGTDPWTARHIEDRKGKSIDELLAQWEADANRIARQAEALSSGRTARLIADTVTHEQDLRGALGRPGGRDTPQFAVMRDAYLFTLNHRVRRAHLPALRLRTERGEWLMGEGEPAATLEAPDFDLARAIAGRRSLRQIAAFRWEGDATTYIPLIPYFPPPEHDLVEAP